MSNYKKHKILKQVKEHYDEINRINNDNLEEKDKSLTLSRLWGKTEINYTEIKNLTLSLERDGMLNAIYKSDDGLELDYFTITDKGRLAIINKTFQNQIWYRKFDFWKFLLPLILSIIALLNSIFNWWDVN